MGFVSLRKIRYDAYSAANAIGWDNIEDIPYEDWIMNRFERSVLNELREVKIGDKIEKHINEDYTIHIDESATDILNAARELNTESVSLNDLIALDYSKNSLSITLVRDGYTIYSGDDVIVPLSDWTLNVGAKGQKNMCISSQQNTLEMKGWVLYNQTEGVPYKGEYTISFGDGNSTVVQSNGGQNNSIFNYEHQYATDGTYTVTVSVRPLYPTAGSSNVVTYSFNVNIDNSGFCTNNNKENTIWRDISSDKKLRGWIKYKRHFHIIRLTHETHVYADTEYWTKKGNKWKKTKDKNVEVGVGYFAKAYDVECVDSGVWINRIEARKNVKSKSITTGNKQGWVRYHYIEGHHHIKIGSTMYDYKQRIGVCH